MEEFQINPDTNCDGIVLLAKQPDITSFSSLFSIKKALDTTKVGHTGTLDSFAQGLLVACTGRLTKLAGCIIEFDKDYEAVIKFGEETDTLEYSGNVIKTTGLPTVKDLEKAIKTFTGDLMQSPPAFSSVHVDGKRASELVRKGQEVVIPPRPVTVFKAELTETKLSGEGLVEYCKINFSVSKGTYIRCLARDISHEAGSSGHLIGLYRTRIGNFNIQDAAGYDLLPEFNIASSIKEMNNFFNNSNAREASDKIQQEKLKEEIRQKKRQFDEETAIQCGFTILHTTSEQNDKAFINGQPIRSALFGTDLHKFPCNTLLAIFSPDNIFRGLIEKDGQGRLHHKFVIC